VTGSCPTCACPYYVKYSTNNGATWLGYTFQGTPGTKKERFIKYAFKSIVKILTTHTKNLLAESIFYSVDVHR
jgi:hypothetical protein